jgi:hypothetical protein
MNASFALRQLALRRFVLRQKEPRWLRDALACAVIVALGYLYLAPASLDIFRDSDARAMGDGSDLVGLSWAYRILVRTLLHDPSRLFFGAVFSEATNAPTGNALWFPWVERVLVPILTPLTNDATIPTAVAWVLMSLNGICTYVFGRILRWPRLVCLAMGICLAYNSYTRARANVHIALVGVFGIVLVFIALELVSSRYWMSSAARKKRSSVWAAVALFFVTFSAHYYLIMLIVLTPFLLVYFLLRVRSSELPMWSSLARLVVCSVPAVLFLGWNFFMPLPPKYLHTVPAVPAVREENVEFLHLFGAHPMDYLGFDLKLGTKDWLKARIPVTEAIRADIGPSNAHERSNGIRWSLLAVLVAAIGAQLWPGRVTRHERRSSQLRGLFLVCATLCFFLSLSPQGLRSYDTEIGPSRLVFKYFPNFRVPSRFGIVAQFAILVVVGEFWVSLMRRSAAMGALAKWVLNPLLPLIAVLDYAPMNPVLMVPFSNARKDLPLLSGECGMGMGIPFAHWEYWIFQQVRGTRCDVMFPTGREPERLLESAFGNQDFDLPAVQQKFVTYARCTGMDWVVMDAHVKQPAREIICRDLGWTFVGSDSCRAPAIRLQKSPAESCL